jgi:hypothetical protein
MPSAESLSPGIQKMMTTYIRMMLGSNLNSPVLFSVIYTPDWANSRFGSNKSFFRFGEIVECHVKYL